MKSSGKIWPYAIGISIILIFGACIATVTVAGTLPVQKSDTYMMDYHEADAKANDILNAAIEFNKKYKIECVQNILKTKDGVVKYKITDIDSNPVNTAKIKVIITRPDSRQYDMELKEPSIENGVYTFNISELPKEGRWDIMAKVSIDAFERFYNIKTDTRNSQIVEY